MIGVNIMNRKLCILLTITLFLSVILSSCFKPIESYSSSPSASADNSLELAILDPDYSMPDEYYTSMKQGAFYNFLNTPYGMYYTIGDFIYYSQYGNTQYTKLCTKADCDHSTNECDAYVQGHKIGYYDDHIYFVKLGDKNYPFKLYLMRMDMNGKNHEIVKTITTDAEMSYSITLGFFHSGYFYFIVTNVDYPGAPNNTDNSFYRIKLDDQSEYEIVYINDLISQISMFTIVGDNVFFYVKNQAVTSGTNFDLYMLSLSNLKWQHMTDQWESFTNCSYDEDYGYCYKHNDGFYPLNLATKKMTKEADFEVEEGWSSNALFYPDYIYVITFEKTEIQEQLYDNQILNIFDRDYNLLDTYADEFKAMGTGNMIEDTGYSIIYTSNYKYPPDYYINKSDIGEGIILHKIGE
jgi:hypothetical protein